MTFKKIKMPCYQVDLLITSDSEFKCINLIRGCQGLFLREVKILRPGILIEPNRGKEVILFF